MGRQITISQKETPKKIATTRNVTIGIDIGDRWSHYCILEAQGEVVEEGRFRTTATSVGKHFQDVPAARIAIEAGTHSIWISEQLARYGHEVIVANVTELHAIVRNIRKSDQVDAENLARDARLDPKTYYSSQCESATGTNGCSGPRRTCSAAYGRCECRARLG
jgi:transposase